MSYPAFPKNFLFGVADADLQVMGERACRDIEGGRATMWSTFAEAGRTWNSESPDLGIDRYHNWKADADLMVAMGIRHYRTSVSMSRLLKSDGSVNKKAVEWYRQYWSYLRSKGVSIYATLYHWELPAALAECGGWTNPLAVEMLIQHAKATYEYLGDLIDEYFTINEPWCSTLLSYHQGAHAPGERDLRKALQAAHHLLLASGLACRELLSLQKDLKVGVVLNSQAHYAASHEAKDLRAATIADCYFNRWFYDPIFTGRYPEEILEVYEPYLPTASREDMEAIRVGNLIHALGVNNYCGEIVRHSDTRDVGYESVKVPNAPENDLGWPVFQAPNYPRGLYDILRQFNSSYKDYGLKAIYITENGMALRSNFQADGNLMPDLRRIDYYQEHLQQVSDAILAGVPIKAYFAWTFMDNYEWAEGYRPESCFGLVYVDRKSLQRTPKASCHWYSGLIKQQKN